MSVDQPRVARLGTIAPDQEAVLDEFHRWRWLRFVVKGGFDHAPDAGPTFGQAAKLLYRLTRTLTPI
jgi:hypothetical protein